MSKRTKSQPLTIQLELLDKDALWNIFDVYGSELTIEQLRVIHKSVCENNLKFEHWLIVNGLGWKLTEKL